MIIPIRVLVIEDSEHDALLTIEALRWDGYEPEFEQVQSALEMRAAISGKMWDVILCDYSMPGFDALAALKLLREANVDVPLIIVSGSIGEETTVNLMKHGATDYLMKDRLTRLGAAVAHALDETRARKEQRQTLAALKSEQILFNSLINTIPDQIYFKNVDSRFPRHYPR